MSLISPRQTVCNAENMIETNSEYFIGWGTLTLINAGLAQAKGRSGLAWFLLSLILGPVATFLIVVMDPPKAKV
ncbi:hypothetical protein SAMN05660733_04035 [Lentzea albidocapillata]|uniref:Antitermination protein NusB n=2 Tax=Lentzea albidocapillata TaxID=40571 RepID=A0A1W2EFM1_9PSEU|nr:hypothetical protein SAMN05660733_04035 [Lentzea albidocapillata]